MLVYINNMEVSRKSPRVERSGFFIFSLMSKSELVSDNDSQKPSNTLENFNEIQFQMNTKLSLNMKRWYSTKCEKLYEKVPTFVFSFYNPYCSQATYLFECLFFDFDILAGRFKIDFSVKWRHFIYHLTAQSKRFFSKKIWTSNQW